MVQSSYYKFEEQHLLALYQKYVVPIYDTLKSIYINPTQHNNMLWILDIQAGYDVDYTIEFTELSIPLIIDFWRWCCDKGLIP